MMILNYIIQSTSEEILIQASDTNTSFTNMKDLCI